jgi:hypothetical protein
MDLAVGPSLRCIPRFQTRCLQRRGRRFVNCHGHRGRGTRGVRRNDGCGTGLAGGAIEPRLLLLVMLHSCWSWSWRWSSVLRRPAGELQGCRFDCCEVPT